MRTRHLTVLGALLLIGCVREMDTEALSVGELRDCVVPPPGPIASWSAPIDLGSLWLFESITLDDSSEVRGAAATVTGDPCAGGLDLRRDAGGNPLPLLVLSSAENAANAARTDSKRLALAPRAGFVDGGRMILYYDHLLLGPGFFDAERLGTGLCVFDGTDTPCDRVAGGATLWSGDALPVRSVFVEDGWAWLVVFRKAAAFEEPCTLTRADLPDIATPAAYRWLNVFSGWIEESSNATTLFDNIGPVTVSWNPYQERFSAVTMDIFESSGPPIEHLPTRCEEVVVRCRVTQAQESPGRARDVA